MRCKAEPVPPSFSLLFSSLLFSSLLFSSLLFSSLLFTSLHFTSLLFSSYSLIFILCLPLTYLLLLLHCHHRIPPQPLSSSPLLCLKSLFLLFLSSCLLFPYIFSFDQILNAFIFFEQSQFPGRGCRVIRIQQYGCE